MKQISSMKKQDLLSTLITQAIMITSDKWRKTPPGHIVKNLLSHDRAILKQTNSRDYPR